MATGQFLEIPSDDVLTQCMHCGLCLPVCPTYALTDRERSSPRGRIRLIKTALEQEGPLTPGFVDEMQFCLDCQACETACPAGVQYGSLVVAARSLIAERKADSWLGRTLKQFFLGTVFRSRRRLSAVARLLRFGQQSGLTGFLAGSGLLRLVSTRLADIQSLEPTIDAVFSSQSLPERLPAYGERRHTVAFLTGCIMDVAFARINIETVELLRRAGCDVIVPASQACCGALAGHNGDTRSARSMAAALIDAFGQHDVDWVVMNSAGCGAFVKEYGHIFAGDPAYEGKARALSSRTVDVTEFLHRIGWKPAGRAAGDERPLRVTYHDACHLAHGQKVTSEPRTLLASLPGIEFVELPEASWCCGSAGIYNITRYDDAMALLKRKIDAVASVAPDVIVTGNPGCMLQVEHGLRTRGMKVQVAHTASFLNRFAG